MNIICRSGIAIITLLQPPNDALLSWKVILNLLLLIASQICLLFLNFQQALRLTNTCKVLRNIGHEMRSLSSSLSIEHERADLDSLLLYTSTLDMNSKIMQIPIEASYLSILMTSLTFSTLLLAQFGYINF